MLLLPRISRDSDFAIPLTSAPVLCKMGVCFVARFEANADALVRWSSAHNVCELKEDARAEVLHHQLCERSNRQTNRQTDRQTDSAHVRWSNQDCHLAQKGH